MSDRNTRKFYKRVVVKVGTSTLTAHGGRELDSTLR